MKKLLIAVLLSLPLGAVAQNDWEVPDAPTSEAVKENPDQKYLAGAVPMENGKVVFHKVISAPGKSAEEVYNILLDFTTRMTKGNNQFETSRIVLTEPEKHSFAAFFEEWLVFRSNAIMLDRTRLKFYLIIQCKDGEADVKLTRISYDYDVNRDPKHYSAEEWITDKYWVSSAVRPLTARTLSLTSSKKY